MKIMKNYILNTLIFSGVLALFLIGANSALASLTIEDCMKSSWTTPVGCNDLLGGHYYTNNAYQYDYTDARYANRNYDTRSYNNQPATTKTPVINNNYYQTFPVTTNKQVASTSSTTKTISSSSTQDKNSTTSSTTAKILNTNNTSEDEASKVSGSQGFNNGLTAMSYTGQSDFLPNSFWSWLIVIFLILIVVILVRLIAHRSYRKVHGVKSHT